MQDKISELVSCIVAALSGCAQHSPDHPAVDHYAEKAKGIIGNISGSGFLSIVVGNDNLIVNNEKVQAKTPHEKGLFLKLRRKGIERITITAGVSSVALKQFLADLAATGSPALSYPGIMVKLAESTDSGVAAPAAPDVREDLGKIGSIFQGMSVYKSIDMAVLDSVVGGFIGFIRREPDVLKLLVNPGQNRDVPFTHAANVSLLSIYQAVHLGLGGEILYDIGTAGLLHDLGRTLVTGKILEKKSPFSEKEWEKLKRHTEYGPIVASAFPDLPDLVLVVAFQHHMKHDGSGYPELKRKGRKKHVVSHMVAVADFFEALWAELPHRKGLPLTAVTGIMKEASGRELNPGLVDNFLLALRKGNPLAFVA